MDWKTLLLKNLVGVAALAAVTVLVWHGSIDKQYLLTVLAWLAAPLGSGLFPATPAPPPPAVP